MYCFETVGIKENSRDIPVPAGGFLTGFEGSNGWKVLLPCPFSWMASRDDRSNLGNEYSCNWLPPRFQGFVEGVSLGKKRFSSLDKAGSGNCFCCFSPLLEALFQLLPKQLSATSFPWFIREGGIFWANFAENLSSAFGGYVIIYIAKKSQWSCQTTQQYGKIQQLRIFLGLPNHFIGHSNRTSYIKRRS